MSKPFNCENGKTYLMPDTSCVFCNHCTDIFYDYTNGPYMFLCEKGHGDFETCNEFEEEGAE